ncbi:bifunctional diaminohydroxyphosphoribosylaminopyrimidine deaminase/5-amino-6-(5-phosphoribosylamino)uracil reductase RibD [Dasania sp. GY-MA-18]|uniref:Riboflavin biosynthesis protein RibD n=1 Tax=Dasania phycosphaerae TaxID=2950436 RepID=A0A9J6RHW5_9GAMM|nr:MULTISPECIES: bifunctional diaminohydroxyphosphoribosylaminopyrimidine deaminase/5-amino-6-(5-phosphoribosylamino)uracil reductase RibD [Dasania]MCR8921526.1 bifunctional diaminohydroxyphosphoribosylaminopyrimidine deaminase/5-amino-6-(5-phosphoribosylamino)uracil reductase RibD [Dasania sp. GY-MA-18]MCZ0863954.1 bifunctional diaminohydroxyphosphoribosylaminopyrimidine deaminase/5-amino-6-(5-phosphoribosylamino)uracil reductase RibD [Dasania phycosphaerae]MCZ0867682.1 bifunctional diaminohydr
MSDHSLYMQRALALAEQGLYTSSPNPRVGCVLVQQGEIIGEGFHRRTGEAHAEVNALQDAQQRGLAVTGATAYVTLEPCSHTGKTPPCCDALIKAGVAKVVVAMQDPNPLVAGAGIQRLRDAGIAVELGVLAEQAEQLNKGFNKRMRQGLPWLRAKLAMSLDGRTAMASGESQWITGPAARSDVQRLRARSSAIISGVDTVLMDQASLTVRAEQLGLDDEPLVAAIVAKQPLRVVLDSTLRLSPEAKLFTQPGPILIITAVAKPQQQQALQAAGAEVLQLSNKQGQVDLAAVMAELGQRGCNEVLLEAGATLAGAFLQQGLLDEITVYMAPTLLGSEARPLFNLPLSSMSQQQRLHIQQITPIGEDWRIDALAIAPVESKG